MNENSTREKLRESAKKHFLRDGFKSSSLNQIVKDTGFTKGAFYFYYSSKEAIFEDLVSETAEGIAGILSQISDEWKCYPINERVYHMTEAYLNHLPELVDYLLAHKDEIRLILTCSEGTKYEDFLGKLQRRDEEVGSANIQSAFDRPVIEPDTYSLLLSGYFMALGKVILSDASREVIIDRLTDIQMVYQYGIMGLIQDKENKKKMNTDREAEIDHE